MVAMARTGSGKTAAFLIPLFERLKVHSAQSGARALILSPTRELAIQTLKFTKEVGGWASCQEIITLRTVWLYVGSSAVQAIKSFTYMLFYHINPTLGMKK